MLVPPSSWAEAYVWRRACIPSSGAASKYCEPLVRGGITLAFTSARFQMPWLKTLRLCGFPLASTNSRRRVFDLPSGVCQGSVTGVVPNRSR
ncbi:hypothetical protein KAURM247S_07729 [Kitasatospora aureofaciens]